MTGKLGKWLFIIAMLLWLIAPALVVIPLAFTDKQSFGFPPSGLSTEWFENLFTDPQWYDSLIASAKVGVLTAIVATVIGTATAIGLWRAGPKTRLVLGAFVLTPMIVPVIVLAIGIYAMFITLGLVGTTLGFVVAHSVHALPLVIINVFAGLVSFDRRLETAAISLGAGRLTVLRTVTIPLLYASVLAGFVLALVTSLDEVALALFIQTPSSTTLPVRMYASVTEDIDPTVSAAAATLVIVTSACIAIALIGMNRSVRRRAQ